MSSISAGTTLTTALVSTGDTTGELVLKTNGGTTAVTIDTSQKATFAADSVINGLTVGRGAGAVSTNTAVGASALADNTTGSQNTAIGNLALNSNTTAEHQTAIGYAALRDVETGSYNTAIGHASLLTNTTGSQNAALGRQSLGSNTTGTYNTAVGHTALYSNTTANNNTAVGYQAGYSNTTGAQGTFIGIQAGYGVTTSSNNIAIGYQAAYYSTALTTGAQNILLGNFTRTSAATSNYQFVIGYDVVGQADNNITIGTASGKIYNAFTSNATWTQTSDERLKKNIQNDTLGLSFINRLRPVKYQWKPSNEVDPSLPYYNEVNQRNTEAVMHGLVAQEVKAALDAEGVTTFAGWDQGSDGIQAISREMFISPLIKAIQELSAQVEALKSEVNTLKGN